MVLAWVLNLLNQVIYISLLIAALVPSLLECQFARKVSNIQCKDLSHQLVTAHFSQVNFKALNRFKVKTRLETRLSKLKGKSKPWALLSILQLKRSWIINHRYLVSRAQTKISKSMIIFQNFCVSLKKVKVYSTKSKWIKLMKNLINYLRLLWQAKVCLNKLYLLLMTTNHLIVLTKLKKGSKRFANFLDQHSKEKRLAWNLKSSNRKVSLLSSKKLFFPK